MMPASSSVYLKSCNMGVKYAGASASALLCNALLQVTNAGEGADILEEGPNTALYSSWSCSSVLWPSLLVEGQ